MRTFAATFLGVLLLPQVGPQAPGPVGIEMRNVILYSERYNEQLVAGYSKNTPDHALRTCMPDFNDLPRRRR